MDFKLHQLSGSNIETIFNKARVITTLGNRAVHNSRPIPFDDGLVAVRELFHFTYWFAYTYSRESSSSPEIKFDLEFHLLLKISSNPPYQWRKICNP